MTEQLNFLDAAEATPRRGEYELPADGTIEHCRSCNAQIIWIHTPAGWAMPLSIATVQTRNGHKYALSHFSDCPDAKGWSKH